MTAVHDKIEIQDLVTESVCGILHARRGSAMAMVQQPGDNQYVTRREMKEMFATFGRHFDESLALSEQRQQAALAASETRLRGEIRDGIQHVLEVTTAQSNELARQIQEVFVTLKTLIERR
jgi:hypothetical protein